MEFKNIEEMIEQIKFCKFKDEVGHPIENNVGFIELCGLARKYRDFYEQNGME